MGRYVDDNTSTTEKSGDAMANNATECTNTHYTHNNGSRGRKMVSTGDKLRFGPGLSHNCVPTETSTKHAISSDQ